MDVTFHFYNPNISILNEYIRRKDELIRLSEVEKVDFIEGPYDAKLWVSHVKDLAVFGEGSKRCEVCYRLRMETTFKHASTEDYDFAGTVLSVSPHKNSEIIRDIGYDLQSKYGIKYLDIDFKKNDGFRRGGVISKNYGFYRQNYCGCIYSFLERKKESGWRKKVTESRYPKNLYGIISSFSSVTKDS
jgi:predicted adenine nucleotide alpha hydrolase (AANH) superfamily ATPase